MAQWRYGSTILDLGTIWIRVISFIPRQLYLLYTISKRLDTVKKITDFIQLLQDNV
jgi:hypothetical protein